MTIGENGAEDAGGGGALAGQFRCNYIGNSLSHVVDGDGSVPTVFVPDAPLSKTAVPSISHDLGQEIEAILDDGAQNGTAYDAVECRAESEVSVPAEGQVGEEATEQLQKKVKSMSKSSKWMVPCFVCLVLIVTLIIWSTFGGSAGEPDIVPTGADPVEAAEHHHLV